MGYREGGNELSGSIYKIQVSSCLSSDEGLCSKEAVFSFLMDYMLDISN